jgi:hypothetical protein
MLADSLVVRGPVGIGKSTAVWLLNELLIDAQVPHAALDLDWLGAAWPQFGTWNLDTRYAHAALLAQSYRAMGVRHFVVCNVVETPEGVERLRTALGADRLAVCRLSAPLEVVEARLRGRESVETLRWFLERAAVLDAQLAADGLDDFVVDATRPARVIAHELLQVMDWGPSGSSSSPT